MKYWLFFFNVCGFCAFTQASEGLTPIPAWMEGQIFEDVERTAHLQGDPHETMRTVHALAGGDKARLVTICIQEGKVSWASEGYTPQDIYLERLVFFLETLEKTHALSPLPDMELLLSLSDIYDRPFFLASTTCPVFTISRSKGNDKTLLIPSHIFYKETPPSPIRWEDKKNMAIWRGSMRDEEYFFFEWDMKPRSRLTLLSKRHPDLLDACFVEEDPASIVGPSIASWMYLEGLFGHYISSHEQAEYKYHIAIDGGATPHSMHWQLFSKSLLLKAQSSRVEWFYAGLIPSVHYLEFDPEKEDIILLLRTLQDNEARKIGHAAYTFANEYLQDSYILCYLHRLLTSYHLYKNHK